MGKRLLKNFQKLADELQFFPMNLIPERNNEKVPEHTKKSKTLDSQSTHTHIQKSLICMESKHITLSHIYIQKRLKYTFGKKNPPCFSSLSLHFLISTMRTNFHRKYISRKEIIWIWLKTSKRKWCRVPRSSDPI